MTFGEKIEKARTAKNLSRKELAALLDMTVPAIRNWEMNLSRPKQKEVYDKIAEVLDISIDYLITNNVDKTIDQRLKLLEQELISTQKELQNVKMELTIMKRRISNCK